MRLNTKNILLMIALLSLGVEGKGNKCIVKPKLVDSTSNVVPTSNAVGPLDGGIDTVEPVDNTDLVKPIEPTVSVNEQITTTVKTSPIASEKKTITITTTSTTKKTTTKKSTTSTTEKTTTKKSITSTAEKTTTKKSTTSTAEKTTTKKSTTSTTKKTTTKKSTTSTITTKKTTTKKSTTTTTKKTTTTKAAPTSSSSKKSLPDITGGEIGKTTRYWDCCVASCSWKENTRGPVVNVCAKDGITRIKNFDYNTGSVCDGGNGHMCNDNQPWAINDKISYGFVAASFTHGISQQDGCCSCYRMQFTSEKVKGKQMIVQVTNTGYDLSSNHFDIQIPGGGVGIFNGCSSQWGSSVNGWGERYGGIKQRSECKNLPAGLRDGCYWRFDWFGNSDNPAVKFERVQCPVELTSKSGCVPVDNSKFKKIPWN